MRRGSVRHSPSAISHNQSRAEITISTGDVTTTIEGVTLTGIRYDRDADEITGKLAFEADDVTVEERSRLAFDALEAAAPKHPMCKPTIFVPEETQEDLREEATFTTTYAEKIEDDVVDAAVMGCGVKEEISCDVTVGEPVDPDPTDDPETFVEMDGVE